MRLALGVVMAAATVGGPAYAQANPAEIADRLFEEGRALAEANRWAEACPKFEASLRRDPAVGTRLNLATCYEHLGKLGRAWRLYQESLELARQAGDVKRRDYAQKHMAAIEPRLAKLVISAQGAPPAGFLVTWGDLRIDASGLGVAQYVDPGTHAISASAPGFEAYVQTVDLVESTAMTFVVPTLTPVSAAPREPGPATLAAGGHVAITEHTAAPGPARRYVMLGAAAAGVAALGGGVVFGVKAHSTLGDARALCGAQLVCESSDYAHGQQLIRDTRSSATVATVLVAIGSAAIVTSVVLYLTGPRSRATTARIAPLGHEHGAGLVVVGGF
jgi:hypothetical protein